MLTIKGKSFTRNRRGETTCRVKYKADTESDALREVPAFYLGLRLENWSGEEWAAGVDEYIVTATYQGLIDDDDEPEEFDTYETDRETREEPIESFPRRDLLVSAYGAYLEDGRLKFPEKLPNRNNRGRLETNPLFGTTSYPIRVGVARWTMTRKLVPSDLWDQGGSIVESLPAGFGYAGTGNAWYVDGPRVVERGSAKQIAMEYRELPEELSHLKALQLLLKNG